MLILVLVVVRYLQVEHPFDYQAFVRCKKTSNAENFIISSTSLLELVIKIWPLLSTRAYCKPSSAQNITPGDLLPQMFTIHSSASFSSLQRLSHTIDIYASLTSTLLIHFAYGKIHGTSFSAQTPARQLDVLPWKIRKIRSPDLLK